MKLNTLFCLNFSSFCFKRCFWLLSPSLTQQKAECYFGWRMCYIMFFTPSALLLASPPTPGMLNNANILWNMGINSLCNFFLAGVTVAVERQANRWCIKSHVYEIPTHRQLSKLITYMWKNCSSNSYWMFSLLLLRVTLHTYFGQD